MVPVACFSQAPGKTWRIGFLGAGERSTAAQPDANIDAFLRGMRELGYVEGRNLAIEWRFAQGNYRNLPALAVELVQARVEVLVTYGTAAVQALRGAIATIPIDIAAAIDPVGSGFVASLARLGGNITGLSAIAVDPGSTGTQLNIGDPEFPQDCSHPESLGLVTSATTVMNHNFHQHRLAPVAHPCAHLNHLSAG